MYFKLNKWVIPAQSLAQARGGIWEEVSQLLPRLRNTCGMTLLTQIKQELVQKSVYPE